MSGFSQKTFTFHSHLSSVDQMAFLQPVAMPSESLASSEGKEGMEKAHRLVIASVQETLTPLVITDHWPKQVKWPN